MIEGLAGLLIGVAGAGSVGWWLWRQERRRAETAEAWSDCWEGWQREQLDRCQRLVATNATLRLALRLWTEGASCQMVDGMFSKN